MYLLVAVLWAIGAILWASTGNPWLSALFGLNAGLYLHLSISQEW